MFNKSDIVKKIPRTYKKDFVKQQTVLIKSRLNLFCKLAIGMYFFAYAMLFLMYMVYGEKLDFDPKEIPVIGILLIGTMLVHFLNNKAKTIKLAKFNAYLFTILLLSVLTKINIIYGISAENSITLYIFLLFLVSFTIPWFSVEIVPITFLHIAAYSYLFFLCTGNTSLVTYEGFNVPVYLDGLIMFSVSLLLCLVIREKEMQRDIENFVLIEEIKGKNEQMEKELELATRVHKTLIPKSIRTALVDVAVLYLPMDYMGGDYAKFHFINDKKMIFFICDVTGHGVSAALLVNRLHAEFERLAKDGKEPGVLLKEINKFILHDFKGTNMYLSAFCCMLDFENMSLCYSNHGHPDQYFYHMPGYELKGMNSNGSLLGLPIEDEAVHQEKMNFNLGDKFFLFTDGIIETRNSKGEEYGKERLEAFIVKNHDLEADRFNHKLLDELNKFKSGNFEDDIFLLNIHTIPKY